MIEVKASPTNPFILLARQAASESWDYEQIENGIDAAWLKGASTDAPNNDIADVGRLTLTADEARQLELIVVNFITRISEVFIDYQHPEGEDATELVRLANWLRAALPLASTDLYRMIADTAVQIGRALSDRNLFAVEIAIVEEAVSLYRTSAVIAPEHDAEEFQLHLAVALNNLGASYRRQHRVSAARIMYDEALELRRALVDLDIIANGPGLARVLYNMGNTLSAQHQTEAALEAQREALALYRALASQTSESFDRELALVLTRLGLGLLAQGHPDTAMEAIEEALALCRVLAGQGIESQDRDLAQLLMLLGSIFVEQGRHREAEEAGCESVARYRRLASANPVVYRSELAMALCALGTTVIARGSPDKAAVAFQEAIALDAQTQLDAFWYAHVELGRLAPSLLVRYEHFRAALNNLEMRRSALTHRDDRRFFGNQFVHLYAEMARCCVDLGRYAEAWHWAERGRGGTLRDLLGSARPRFDDEAQRQLFEQWQEAEKRLVEAERSLQRNGYHALRSWADVLEPSRARAIGHGSEGQSSAEAYRAARDVEAKLRRRVIAEIDSARPLLDGRVPPPGVLIELLRQFDDASDPGTRPVLVEFALLDTEHYLVFLVPLWAGAGEVDIAAIEVALTTGGLLHLSETFDCGLERLRNGLDPEWAGLAAELSDVLVLPWWTQLAALAPTMLFLVAGEFQPLPLEAATLADGTSWIELYPIVRLPSAAQATALVARQRPPEQPTRGLVVGPPHDDLPGAALESAGAARLFGQTERFAGSKMRVDVLRQHARRLAVLHLATHSVFDSDDYLQSHILFHDERLTVGQLIADARLDFAGMRLCYLSSCASAEQVGEEFGGLVWALLYAGAGAVLGSLWAVNDGAAADMAEALYDYWAGQRLPLAEAHRRAVLAVRERYDDPYYWASFVLAGNGFVQAPALAAIER